MSRAIIAIRPEPGNSATIERAHEIGLEVQRHPLFEVAPVEWDLPDPSRYDAILAGSGMLFRTGGEGLSKLSKLPVHAVGKSTAQLAKASGFSVELVGERGLQSVLDQLPNGQHRLLRLGGEARVELDPPEGVTVDEVIVYRVSGTTISSDLSGILATDCIVLLHSAEAGKHFASEVDRLAIARGNITIVTLGPRISAVVGGGWAGVNTAEAPNDAALLALARQLCD